MGHTFTNHLYHIVFSTRGRRPWLAARVRERVYEYIGGSVRNRKGVLIRIGGAGDHVHMLVRIPPDAAVSRFVGDAKANSSRWVSQTFTGLRAFGWQAGYSSFTVSESRWREVVRYIDSQEEHHRRMSFAEEIAELLRRHGVEFDPEHYLD